MLLGQRPQVAQHARPRARRADVQSRGGGDLVEAEPGARARCGCAARCWARSAACGRPRAPIRSRVAAGACRAAARRGSARSRAGRPREPGEHAEEVGELPRRRLQALEDRQRLLGRREVVVDVEAAHLSLVRHGYRQESGEGCSKAGSRCLGRKPRHFLRSVSLRPGRPPGKGALERGQDGDQDQQDAERDGPHGEAVGTGADALVRGARRAARRGRAGSARPRANPRAGRRS